MKGAETDFIITLAKNVQSHNGVMATFVPRQAKVISCAEEPGTSGAPRAIVITKKRVYRRTHDC
jgi:hypothetical protein